MTELYCRFQTWLIIPVQLGTNQKRPNVRFKHDINYREDAHWLENKS